MTNNALLDPVDDVTRREFIGGAVAAALVITACASDEEAQSAATDGGNYPVTIEHIYGGARLEAEPRRVVTLGSLEQEHLYALGVAPVGVHDYDALEYAHATGPWAEAASNGATPSVLETYEINFEWVASLEPDLITAIYYDLSREDYDTLSEIAPVIVQPAGYGVYQTPWTEKLRMFGRALDREARAGALIAETEGRIAAFRADHPEFAGLKVQTPWVDAAGIYIWRSDLDVNRFLGDIGLEVATDFDDLVEDVSATLSMEQIEMLDVLDVAFLYGSEADVAALHANPLYQSLRLGREGRGFRPSYDLQMALNANSPLSIPFALDRLGPLLTAAADGDPTTSPS